MKRPSIAVIILIATAAGCSGRLTQPDRVPTGRSFDLRVGDSALTTDDVQIRFDTVRSDSRCPMDVMCVRAGEAVIALTIGRTGEVPVGRELDTTAARSSTDFRHFTITLSSLQPYPQASRPIQPGDYIGTFVVKIR